MYYIFILHQTTTLNTTMFHLTQLYYIFILHQTTTHRPKRPLADSCIISSFYIKPQLQHGIIMAWQRCIISSFYIKPQRRDLSFSPELGCIISSFYIKPQLYLWTKISNRRCIISSFYIKPQRRAMAGLVPRSLYYIFILHQTTTL